MCEGLGVKWEISTLSVCLRWYCDYIPVVNSSKEEWPVLVHGVRDLGPRWLEILAVGPVKVDYHGKECIVG